MKRENIQTIIRDLFRDNYRANPDSYPSQVGDAVRLALLTAKGYWENRTEDEMIRDAKANVNLADYENWVKAELTELKKQSVN